MMKYFIQMTALLFILIGFSATAAEQGTSIVATVNGEAITLGQVLSESSGGEAAVKSYAGGEAYTNEISKLRQAAVDRIIDRKLLIGEFKRLKLVLPKNYVESMLDNLAVNLGCKSRSELAAKARSMNTSIDELREKASERLMAEMVMGREFYAAGTPTPKEINEYFVKNQARFSQDEKVKLALLLLPENSPQTTVDELALQLKKDHRRFAELVKAFSCGPNREQGGAVGFIERKNLRKEFAGVLPTGEIKADQVYGPVKTPEGRYFIKIMEVIPGKQAKLADHRHAIRQELENQAKEKALEALKKRLRDRASIRYYYGSKAAENKSAAVENKNSVKTEKIPSKQPIKKMEKKTMVTLKTNHGDIKLELFADAAPKTVANFLEYVKSGFYNGTLFHRVIDNFMIQGGGFDQNFKQKKTREPIENEADNRLSNEIGTIAMARTMDPHSATAQFFINVANNDFLDFRSPSPQFYGYCVFGKVVEGMDVVNKIKTVKTGGRAGHQDVPKEDVVIIEAVAE